LTPYKDWTGVPASALGYDLENAQTIVSFGAPMLDGWGTPGTFTRLWAERAAGMTDAQLRLIQVDSSFSRTAGRAWQWVRVPAGSEAALAGGLARVLLEEHLVAARGPIPSLTLAAAADRTGLTVDSIRALARTIISRTPVVAIAADANPAIAALNVVLGAVGGSGGIVRRSKHARAYVSADAVIPSARAVLIDSTVPWNFVPRTDAEVFRFAAWDGGSSTANWLLPAPGFLEELTDVPTAPTSAIETYAVASAIVKATPDVQSAAQFLCGIDPALTSVEKIIHGRCTDLFRAHAGTLRAQEATPVAKFTSVQKLEEALQQGSVWTSDPPHTADVRCELKEWPADTPSVHLENWASTWAAPVLPPLASKLYQESSLREPPERSNA
jgi:anaerobic selenocysteine-containing dehydrogenase